jgi:hypothetical protein
MKRGTDVDRCIFYWSEFICFIGNTIIILVNPKVLEEIAVRMQRCAEFH